MLAAVLMAARFSAAEAAAAFLPAVESLPVAFPDFLMYRISVSNQSRAKVMASHFQ
jgi:hypothetical protein